MTRSLLDFVASQLSELKSLMIEGVAADASLAVLSGLTNLEHLQLSGCNLHLRGLDSLTSLRSLAVVQAKHVGQPMRRGDTIRATGHRQCAQCPMAHISSRTTSALYGVLSVGSLTRLHRIERLDPPLASEFTTPSLLISAFDSAAAATSHLAYVKSAAVC
jgi:hypothetical protein